MPFVVVDASVGSGETARYAEAQITALLAALFPVIEVLMETWRYPHFHSVEENAL